MTERWIARHEQSKQERNIRIRSTQELSWKNPPPLLVPLKAAQLPRFTNAGFLSDRKTRRKSFLDANCRFFLNSPDPHDTIHKLAEWGDDGFRRSSGVADRLDKTEMAPASVPAGAIGVFWWGVGTRLLVGRRGRSGDVEDVALVVGGGDGDLLAVGAPGEAVAGGVGADFLLEEGLAGVGVPDDEGAGVADGGEALAVGAPGEP